MMKREKREKKDGPSILLFEFSLKSSNSTFQSKDFDASSNREHLLEREEKEGGVEESETHVVCPLYLYLFDFSRRYLLRRLAARMPTSTVS